MVPRTNPENTGASRGVAHTSASPPTAASRRTNFRSANRLSGWSETHAIAIIKGVWLVWLHQLGTKMKILGASTFIVVDACSGTLDWLGSGPARVQVPLANPPLQAPFKAAAPPNQPPGIARITRNVDAVQN